MIITSKNILKLKRITKKIMKVNIMIALRTNPKKMVIMAVITKMTGLAQPPAIMKMNTTEITISTSTKTMSTKRKSKDKVKH